MSSLIQEIREKRFIHKVLHKMKRNINDNSAYLGDLLVTGFCFSRNRLFGNMLGKEATPCAVHS
jgi:glycerol-3-phosphate dehydrogenase (NAD(P)+)